MNDVAPVKNNPSGFEIAFNCFGHGLLLIILGALILFVAPKLVAKYADLGAELPTITIVAMNLVNLIQSCSIFIIYIASMFLVVDVATYILLYRQKRSSAKLWSFFVTISQCLVILFFVMAMFLPMIQLLGNLGR